VQTPALPSGVSPGDELSGWLLLESYGEWHVNPPAALQRAQSRACCHLCSPFFSSQHHWVRAAVPQRGRRLPDSLAVTHVEYRCACACLPSLPRRLRLRPRLQPLPLLLATR